MSEAGRVGMSELRVARSPWKLAAYGVGSCVVLALWDPSTGLGGLAHSMLPSAAGSEPGEPAAKYCDTAVGALLEALEGLGARRRYCRAWLVGGATMFAFPPREGLAPLGERNLSAARESLRAWNLELTAEDSGGVRGRSLELDCSDGTLRVWSAAEPARRL